MSERFETYAYLAPLTNQQIQAHLEFMLEDNLLPVIEYADSPNGAEIYWHNWPIPVGSKLSVSWLMTQIESCHRRHPYAHIRLSAYNKKQKTITTSFIAKTPLEAA